MDIDNGIDRLGARLREARIAQGFTQKRLAQLLDVREKDVSRWESGEHAPSTPRLARLAVALGVSADWLLGIEGPRPRSNGDVPPVV